MFSAAPDVFLAVPVTVIDAPLHALSGLGVAVHVTAGGGMHVTPHDAVACASGPPGHSLVASAVPLNVTVPEAGHVAGIVAFTVPVLVSPAVTTPRLTVVPLMSRTMVSSLSEVF